MRFTGRDGRKSGEGERAVSRQRQRVASMAALILQCKTFQRSQKGGESRPGDFQRRERKDIDGYGDLMAYCSTRIAL